MIASSPVAKGAALLAALALHAALLWDYSPNPTETQTEGASGARETRLGDSFEDMTTGVLAPMPAPRAEAVTPTTAQSVPTVAALPAQAPACRVTSRDTSRDTVSTPCPKTKGIGAKAKARSRPKTKTESYAQKRRTKREP